MPLLQYDQNRSLIEQVTEVLRNGGHSEPEDWKEYASVFVPIAVDETQDHPVQRHYINRCMRMYMCEVQVDSSEARTHLFDDGRINDWFRHFQQEVAPWLIKNTPPRTN